MRRKPPRVSPSCTRVSGPIDPMMRARPLALARTTVHPRATEFTQPPDLRDVAAGGLAAAVDRAGAGAAFRGGAPALLAAERVVAFFGGAFATALGEAFGFARDGAGAAAAGALRPSEGGGATATRVVLEALLGRGVVAEGGGGATVSGGVATVVVRVVAVTGGGDRRITDG